MSSGCFASPSRSWLAIFLILAIALPTISAAAAATATGPVARITDRINEDQRVSLSGHVNPAITGSLDLGPADRALPAERIVMVLRASAAQEAELAQFLRGAQIPGREEYHRWLTPQDADASVSTPWRTPPGKLSQPDHSAGWFPTGVISPDRARDYPPRER
jgi:hypothetical protein